MDDWDHGYLHGASRFEIMGETENYLAGYWAGVRDSIFLDGD